MKINKINIKVAVTVIFVLGITAFIIVNSLMSYETSHNSSSVVTDIITTDKIDNSTMEHIVRKFAHLFEYTCLGICVMSLAQVLKKLYNKSFLGFSFFFALGVAVTDEYLQGFFERSSSIEDIILDFVGALLGFGLVFVIIYARRATKRHNTK